MEVFAILTLVIVLAVYLVTFKSALEDSGVRACDCQHRDPHRCIKEQCFDADDEDHSEECKFCLDGCACDCHYARKSEDKS